MSQARPLAFAAAGLSKSFETVTAVANVSFVVPAGKVAALVGPMGAGKTTVLRMLLGQLRPTSGSASVGGPGSGVRAGRQAIGAVLSPRGLHPARTVRGQLRVYAAAAGVSDARVDELLTLVRLDQAAGERIATQSPGAQTRLALAAALLGNPPLLLLDDPAAGLDAAETAWLNEYLHGHARRGGTVLLTSRTLSAAIPVADELIVMDHGKIVYQGSPARLRRSHPDRILVKSSSQIALATALAARGHTDAVMRPDGRLAVAETTLAQLESAAASARVQLTEIASEHIHPDQVLAALTRPATPAHPAPVYPTMAPAHGMPR
ncbi:ATP-binding cassette domain-containing protein [Nocardia yamanashiensis]|uniref:ATP-binding cassette domain-containing protein n=1 Tax=Nocardia yamanashiensis TaxID=209247 RepID=UPI001E4AFE94|nr:ATP-binding cassette domain-containing protein [Nocardia yamanashiensis]UGT38608.1 ATP-binding cassette domain-containing protein [Nocardia yamanashiensis]